jgi:benzodiazapine receptor
VARKALQFLICLIPPYAAALTGVFFKPGAWYQGLNKPWWTPPPLTFPIVWNILYILMGVTLYLLLQKGLLKKKLGLLYWGQLIFNALWTPVFFGAQFMTLGFILIFCLLGLVLAFEFFIYNEDKNLFFLNIPYVLWLLVASSLNLSLIFLNY